MFEPVDYRAIAQRLSDQVNAMRAEVPFLSEQRQTDLRRLISTAGVPDDFIQYLAVVIGTHDRVSAAIQHDASVMVSQRDCATAFDRLESDLRALADGIHATMMILRAESGKLALDAYALLQSMLRHPGGMNLAPEVRALRQLLGRGRPRKKAAPAPGPEEETPAS
jgi:hypothetical protein